MNAGTAEGIKRESYTGALAPIVLLVMMILPVAWSAGAGGMLRDLAVYDVLAAVAFLVFCVTPFLRVRRNVLDAVRHDAGLLAIHHALGDATVAGGGIAITLSLAALFILPISRTNAGILVWIAGTVLWGCVFACRRFPR